VVETLAHALSRDDLTTDAASGIWNTKTRNVIRESVERVLIHDEEVHIVLKTRAGGYRRGSDRRRRQRFRSDDPKGTAAGTSTSRA
jgi:hypothetical protein